MGFKEEFSRQMTRFGRKTSAFVEESKLRTSNSGLEADMKGLYRTAGEAAYALWAEGKLESDELKPYFLEIKEKEDQIQGNRRLIQQIQQQGQEETAATAAPAQVIYVPPAEPDAVRETVGQTVSQEKPDAEKPETVKTDSDEVGEWSDLERMYCPNCGNECRITANYCRKCGTKLR